MQPVPPDQRVVLGRPWTAQVTYGQDGDPVPGSAPTLTLIDSEGNTVTAGAVTNPSTGVYTAPVAGNAVTQLDLLTATWTAGTDTRTTMIDVCESRLFTLAQARAYPELADTSKYPDARLEQERLAAEGFLEQACECAFTGRYGTDTFEPPNPSPSSVYGQPTSRVGRPADTLVLSRPFVRKVRSITSDGTAFTTDDLGLVTLDEGSGLLRRVDGWTGETVVAYEHGRRAADVDRVCLILARHRLIKGPLDDRAVSVAVEGGGVATLLTPGVKGAVTGLPEVDAFILRNSQRVPGVA